MFKALTPFLPVLILTWTHAGQADPITAAKFTVSGEVALDCPKCPNDWRDALQTQFDGIRSPKMITGHIVQVNLAHPHLALHVRRRDPDGPCRDFSDATRYDPDLIVQPLPVLLRTVDGWAEETGVDIAFSGSNFKFQNVGGVRANPPCGEMIGVNLRNGHLDWPPTDAPDMLHENIDFNDDWPAYALLFHSDRTAHITYVEDYAALEPAAHGIAGSLLFDEQGDNPNTGSKPNDLIARLGVGILEGRDTVIILKLEGDNNKTPGMVKGHKMNRLRKTLKSLGAIEAINLDGSGSAHMVIQDSDLGRSSRPADTQGARPIANHFGFRVMDAPVTWTSYGERQGEE